MYKSIFRKTLLFFLLSCPLLEGRDFTLLMGGGPNPQNNQIVLENNMNYLTRILDLEAQDQTSKLLFSDGLSKLPDLHYIDKDKKLEKIYYYLSEILGPSRGVRFRYRSSHIKKISNSSTLNAVKKNISDLAYQLRESDQVLIYFTGHGSASLSYDPFQTRINLWKNASINVEEFNYLLSLFKKKTKVILVLTQCYSGGFAELVVDKKMKGNFLSHYNRVGFFSTRHDKIATGCSPYVQETRSFDYTHLFFSALTGKLKDGQKVELVDYNLDGKTSFSEAHAYVMIHADTLDIPIKTSDHLVRRLGKKRIYITDWKEIFIRESKIKISRIINKAFEPERTILKILKKKLFANKDRYIIKIRNEINSYYLEKKSFEIKIQSLINKIYQVKVKLKFALLAEYPYLDNPWNPQTYQDITYDKNKIIKKIESHRLFSVWTDLENKKKKLLEKKDKLLITMAFLERFLYVSGTVLLSKKLANIKDQSFYQDYLKLKKNEDKTFI